ncbi:MAG: hypothetical protein JWM11_5871 [Planctomycetaceae bacterium]|nr:hypothetical protein [Planctomycetaceae bacterium]
MTSPQPHPASLLTSAGLISAVVGSGLIGLAALIWMLLPHSQELVARLSDKTTAIVALCVALIPLILILLILILRLAIRSTLALNHQAVLRQRRIWEDVRAAQFWLLLPLCGIAIVLIRPALIASLAPGSAIGVILSWLPEYSAWCAAVGSLAFLHFGADKYVAIKRETTPNTDRRTAEKFLIAFVLWGGWAGAFAAMAAFRHKTADVPFRTGLWKSFAIHGIIVISCLALVYWRTTK